jgi:chemotaxis protein CheX
MDVKLLNPFIQAAVEVLKAEVNADVSRGDISLQKSAMTSDDITVLINLIGDVYGVVMYGMPIATGLSLVSKILEQDFAELNSLALSGVAELGNVVSGQATIRFSEAGYKSNISPPMVLTGKGTTISTLDFPRIVVPFTTQCGQFTVHLALREKVPGVSHNPDEFISLVNVPIAQKGS